MSPDLIVFAILLVTVGCFVWGRIRHDIVAMLALLAGVLTGVVPFDKAFIGFADDVVIIVACALIISAAISRSGLINALLDRLSPYLTSTQLQVMVLAALAAALSGFIKNIAALAILIPLALQIARRSEISASLLLMPIAFGALLGGLLTLMAGSPNIIVSRMRTEMTGTPFAMFDFAPVGVIIAIAGVLYLAVGYRFLPKDRRPAAALDASFNIKEYITEAVVTKESTVADLTIAEFESKIGEDVVIASIIRNDARRLRPTSRRHLRVDDVLLLEGEPDALERTVLKSKLQLSRKHRSPDADNVSDDVGVVEAVIGPNSLLAGRTAENLLLYDRFNVNLLAVSRQGSRVKTRLRDAILSAGDVIILQGDLTQMSEVLRDLDCLPLANRKVSLAQTRDSLVPIGIFAVAIALVVTGVLPISVAFFGAAVLILLVGALPLREAYEHLDGSVLVLLAAMIPISDAVRATGGTEKIAGLLAAVSEGLPSLGALGLVLVTAMLVTPFLNNAATVLVMAPVAASVAGKLGLGPDAFLMAVAIGASCDFLTPFGHQCNTLVLGPGGYRFTDYIRLGLPLSILVVILGTPLIAWVWRL